MNAVFGIGVSHVGMLMQLETNVFNGKEVRRLGVLGDAV